MTRDSARSTAQDMAARCRVGYVVYRLPKWREGVFGVIGQDRDLPHEAQIVEHVEPPVAAPMDRLF